MLYQGPSSTRQLSDQSFPAFVSSVFHWLTKLKCQIKNIEPTTEYSFFKTLQVTSHEMRWAWAQLNKSWYNWMSTDIFISNFFSIITTKTGFLVSSENSEISIFVLKLPSANSKHSDSVRLTRCHVKKLHIWNKYIINELSMTLSWSPPGICCWVFMLAAIKRLRQEFRMNTPRGSAGKSASRSTNTNTS